MADCKLTPQRRRCDYEFTPQLIRKYDERGRTGQITLSCDFYLALRQELMNTRNQAMAETGLNYSPVAPAISPVLPDDQSARRTPSGAPPTGCESTVSPLWS